MGDRTIGLPNFVRLTRQRRTLERGERVCVVISAKDQNAVGLRSPAAPLDQVATNGVGDAFINGDPPEIP